MYGEFSIAAKSAEPLQVYVLAYHTKRQDVAALDGAPGRSSVSAAIDAMVVAWRRLSLSYKFIAITGVVTVVAMVGLATWVNQYIASAVVRHSATTTTQYLIGFLEPLVGELDTSDTLSPAAVAQLDNTLARVIAQKKVIAIKVWSPGGRVAYASDHSQMGKTFPISKIQSEAWHGRIGADYERDNDDEHTKERSVGVPLIEVYMPVFSARGGRVFAVIEAYETADHLARELQRANIQSTLAIGALMFVILSSLFHVVGAGSRTIQQQASELEGRVTELAQLLRHNNVLKQRVEDASRRSVESNEAFLRRVGAELHDGPAQLIGLSLLRLDSLAKRSSTAIATTGNAAATTITKPGDDAGSDATQDRDIDTIRSSLRESLTEIRAVCEGLLLPELVDVTAARSIEMAAQNHQYRTGTLVALDIGDGLSNIADAPLVTCIYRLTQEGLNNAFRHAGGVGQSVMARVGDGKLVVEIGDDGKGSGQWRTDETATTPPLHPPMSGGLGLRGLADRINSLGGTLAVEAKPSGGTLLRATFDIKLG